MKRIDTTLVRKISKDLVRVHLYGESMPFFSPWVEMFAWTPTKVNGNTVWLKKYYCRKKMSHDADAVLHLEYEYGTILDVMRTTSER